MRWLRCTLVALAMVAGCAARGEVRIELPALPAPDPPPRVAVADVERTLQPERELEPADGGAQLGARYEIARAWVAEGRVTQAESLLAAEAPADAAHPLALPWAYALAWTRYALERYPEGQEPKAEWVQAEPTAEKWGSVLAQDFSNMEWVQKGMKSRGFRGTLPNPHQEQKVTNFHRHLARYMGIGAPRLLGK